MYCHFCGSKWRIWVIWWVLRWLLLYVYIRRRQEWKAHFRLLQHEADFHPEIRIARLPNRTPDKLKGWRFFLWHSIEDPFKIQTLTAKTFSRNAAFEAISIRGRYFVCQGATVMLFAPRCLDDAKQCPVTNALCGREVRGIFAPAIHLLTSLNRWREYAPDSPPTWGGCWSGFVLEQSKMSFPPLSPSYMNVQ